MADEWPLLMMSTESVLKHESLAQAMKRAGIPVRVDGVKVPSDVSEQPLTMNETYQGAQNRHRALLELNRPADYYATIESGLHRVHEAHGVYGCNVVIIHRAGDEASVGFAIDVEFPQEMLDKVPSVYPDLGVLVQEEFGANEKDPYPYFTNGRLTRRDTLEAAVYNLAIQLNKR